MTKNKTAKKAAPKKANKKVAPQKPAAVPFAEEAVVITPVVVEVTEIVQISNDNDEGFSAEQTTLFSED